jgi:hypothetical protein
LEAAADIEWFFQRVAAHALNRDSITEDGAEAVALSYANASEGWVQSAGFSAVKARTG